MRNGTILSTILHAGVLALLVFGLPSFVTPLNQTIVPLEMVTLEDLMAEAAKPAPEPPPKPQAEEKAPEPEPTPEPEPPPQVAKLEPEPTPPEPEPEPEPEPPQAEPIPEPEPAPPPPEATPEPEPELAAPPPVPKRRPEVKVVKPKPPEPPKPKRDQLASILRNVEKLKDQPRETPRPTPDQTAKAPETGPARPLVSVFEQNQMVQAIQQQLRACWRLDPGAREAEDMVVEIRVVLNPDGSVRQADIVDVVRMVQDAYFRSAAENAKRAIDVCSPFRLPIRKYDVWRELTLRFNPREMFGT